MFETSCHHGMQYGGPIGLHAISVISVLYAVYSFGDL